MTSYDILAPTLLLILGLAGVGIMRWQSHRLDQKIEAAEREKAAREG
jgi:hypothetical protein